MKNFMGQIMAGCDDCNKYCDDHHKFALVLEALKTKVSLVGWIFSLLLAFLISFVTYTHGQFVQFKDEVTKDKGHIREEVVSLKGEVKHLSADMKLLIELSR